MIHIAPWAATQALIDGAAGVLPDGGVLFLYGPLRREGRHTAPNNAAFDASCAAPILIGACAISRRSRRSPRLRDST